MELGRRANLVFHDKKMVFMLLKKCGSVTMGRTLLASLGHKDLDGPNVNKVLGELPHFNRHQVAALDYTKVVWVRNPFDRLVSGWYDRIHNIDNKDTMAWYGVPNTISFSDFIDWVCSIDDYNMNVHFKQQTADITIAGELVPNVIIKLENLIEDWAKLRTVHTWLHKTIFTGNKSNKGNYRNYYTPTLVDKVKLRFKDDFSLLGYREEI